MPELSIFPLQSRELLGIKDPMRLGDRHAEERESRASRRKERTSGSEIDVVG